MTDAFDFESGLIAAKDTMEQVRFILETVQEDGEFQDVGFSPKLYYLIRSSSALLEGKLHELEAAMAATAGAQ